MIQSIVSTTEFGNLYLYDDYQKMSLLIHPELKKAHYKSEKVDPYYQGKYEYLKKYGFFSKPQMANLGEVNETMVEEGIRNVPQIIFEVTDFCNLDCTYCGYGDLYKGHDIRNTSNINTQKAITFLKYVLNLKHKSKKSRLSIGFYGGEALINIKFVKQIVAIAKQLNEGSDLKIQYSMTTNATLIDKYIDFFVENEFDISISLDGNRENNSYRIYRNSRKNSFEKVIENVDMIYEKYKDYFINHINFISVLHDRNRVKDIHHFIYGKYHKAPIIIGLATKDIDPKKKSFFNSMYREKKDSEREYLNDAGEDLYKDYYTPLVHNETKDFLNIYSINYYLSNLTSLLIAEEKYYPTSTCLPLGRKMFLTTKGYLLPCEKVSNKYCMGVVGENVEIDISKITKQHIRYYKNLKKVCQNCYAYKFCGLCMYHISNLDKLDTENFVCEYFYDQSDFSDKLYRVFSYLEKSPNKFFNILENSEK